METRYGELGQWQLHWLNPVEKEVRTLTLKARMPVLQGWDAQGLHWQDLPLPDEAALQGEASAVHKPQSEPAAARQRVVAQTWQRAAVEPLRQGMNGLWLRIQDLRYAEALLGQDDCPWKG